jgi:hypothetical protein
MRSSAQMNSYELAFGVIFIGLDHVNRFDEPG